MKVSVLLGLGLVTLWGCGGSSSSNSLNIAPGYYRGTFNFTANGLPDASAPMIADVQANGDLTGHAFGPSVNAVIAKSGATGSLVYNSISLSAAAQLVPGSGNLDLTISEPTGFTVTATLTPQALPTLGATATVPPAGNYSGELLVVSNGHVQALGTVTASFDSSGSWTAQSSGGTSWVNSGLFTGQFNVDGTVANASIIITGNIHNQATAPQYSFDGTTLIVRYDSLALEPGSAWLTLTASP